MNPTMKLRFLIKSVPAPGHGPDIRKQVQILQQWWEGAKIKKEYEHLAPGSIIPWDGKEQLMTYEAYGEWRDIPIEVKP